MNEDPDTQAPHTIIASTTGKVYQHVAVHKVLKRFITKISHFCTILILIFNSKFYCLSIQVLTEYSIYAIKTHKNTIWIHIEIRRNSRTRTNTYHCTPDDDPI
jgi:hypothetical protein